MAGLTVSSGLPSEEELVKIHQIQTNCKSEIQALQCQADDVVGDLRVCRFLRARNGDVKGATEWFKSFLVWRVDEGMDTMRQEVVGRSPENFLQWYYKRANPYFPLHPWAGRTEAGNAVVYLDTNGINAKQWVNHRQVPLEEDGKLATLTCEWWLWQLDVLSRAEGRMVYITKVFDEGGLNSQMFMYGAFRTYVATLVKLFAKHYCEHDEMFLFVNTPFYFKFACSLFKPFLSKRQMDKFCVLGDVSKPATQETLLTHLGAACLLKSYGGSIESLPGHFPLPTSEEKEAWYRTRHLLPVELASEPSQDAIKNDLPTVQNAPAKEVAMAPAPAKEVAPVVVGKTLPTLLQRDGLASSAQMVSMQPALAEKGPELMEAAGAPVEPDAFEEVELKPQSGSWCC